MTSPHDPAFPNTDFTRVMGSNGLTAHEVYTLALLAAETAHSGMSSIGEREVQTAKTVAALALSHRVPQ